MRAITQPAVTPSCRQQRACVAAAVTGGSSFCTSFFRATLSHELTIRVLARCFGTRFPYHPHPNSTPLRSRPPCTPHAHSPACTAPERSRPPCAHTHARFRVVRGSFLIPRASDECLNTFGARCARIKVCARGPQPPLRASRARGLQGRSAHSIGKPLLLMARTLSFAPHHRCVSLPHDIDFAPPPPSLLCRN